MIDPYAILGLIPDATKEEVQQRFRELAKKTHPDLHRGKKEFEEKFKMYSEAYNMILEEKELLDKIENDTEFFHQHFRQRKPEPQYRQEEPVDKKEKKTEYSTKSEEENLSYEEFLQYILKKQKEENKREKKEKEIKANKEEEISIPEVLLAFWWIIVIIINFLILL